MDIFFLAGATSHWPISFNLISCGNKANYRIWKLDLTRTFGHNQIALNGHNAYAHRTSYNNNAFVEKISC